MLKERSTGDVLILISTILYIISLFLPWVNLAFTDSASGFAHRGYIVLILFFYPVFTVFAKKSPGLLGISGSLAAAVFLLYYIIKVSQHYMGASVSEAGTGLYIALLSSLVLVTGVILKLKDEKQKPYESSGIVK
ncbi:hypothetical protein SAMN05216232_0622 [Virgibacillus subterraneus]|uniref:Uncharacterized protein n=2 Tax=Virgibacillus TaxID=84406 RepID=A0A1H0Y8E9_9BACI|nr:MULTISPECIES: hypothetical protein [Virgibacillus]SDQ11427.1 hypothetical protein SAMN05216231_0492 [Virgibacillus salinus]SEP69998.1 hypothetical protein SAMN05216232_0622 [Virgibacillus subterraneus]